jgi:alkaline phosphatase
VGVDILMGGGRRFFVSNAMVDEEGARGARTDGRDLRAEFRSAGYNYVWNKAGFDAAKSLPVRGMFESSHMEYEFDRPSDLGGEPSLRDMTVKAIQLLSAATKHRSRGYFLHVESGRIDHAHHAGNAYRALIDTQELDEAIGAAAQMVDLRDTLIIVSADHSHVFNITRYPLRPLQEMPRSDHVDLTYSYIGMYKHLVARASTTSDPFNAIAEPARRTILEFLAGDERSVTEIADALAIGQPSVSKHMQVLRDVNLVHVRRDGRRTLYRVNMDTLRTIHDWSGMFARYWSGQLRRIKAHAEEKR